VEHPRLGGCLYPSTYRRATDTPRRRRGWWRQTASHPRRLGRPRCVASLGRAPAIWRLRRRRPLQRYGASVADACARGAYPCRPVVTYSDSPGAPPDEASRGVSHSDRGRAVWWRSAGRL